MSLNCEEGVVVVVVVKTMNTIVEPGDFYF
jgi:hypothetical protein